MVPDLTLETIYYKQPTDFKMEYDLCSVCNTRFLATTSQSGRDFLLALQKSVSRSRVIVTVGGIESKDYLPVLICRAINEQAVSLVSSVNAQGMGYSAPAGAIPLLDTKNNLCGLVIERKDQSIVMLSEVKERRDYAVKNLVIPYFKLIVSKNRQKTAADIQPKTEENNIIAPPSVPMAVPVVSPEVEAPAKARSVVVPRPVGAAKEHNAKTPNLSKESKTPENQETVPKLSIEDEILDEVAQPEEIESQDVTVEELSIENEILQDADKQDVGKHDRAIEPLHDDLNYVGRHSKSQEVIDGEVEESPAQDEADTDFAIENDSQNTDAVFTINGDAEQDLTETAVEEDEDNDKVFVLDQSVIDNQVTEEEPPAYVLKDEIAAAFASPGEDDSGDIELPDEAADLKEDLPQGGEDDPAPQPQQEQSKYTVSEQPEKLDDKSADDFKMAPSKSHKVLKIIISILLVLSILAGAFFGYTYLYEPSQAESIYQSIVSLYGQRGDAQLPEKMLDSFGRLYELNKNIAGMLKIDNTSIYYPVVKTSFANTSYCNTHLFDGSFNGYGTPYTLSAVDYDSFERNTVIFGKSVPSGKMFSDLSRFLSLDFYKENPTVTFNYTYGDATYKIFSVMQFKDGSFNYSKSMFFDDSSFEDFLYNLKSASQINTSVDVKGSDCILTLATKQDSNIIAVFARKLRDGEENGVNTVLSDINIDPMETAEIISDDNPSAVSPTFENKNNSSDKFEQAPISKPVEIAVKPSSNNSAALPVNAVTSLISGAVSSKATNSTTSSKTQSTATTSASSKTSSTSTATVTLPTLYVTNSKTGKKVKDDALTILEQVVEAEIGATYQAEALKAQAVAAYGWMLTNGAADGKSYPTVPMKPPSDRCKKAVAEVAGIVPIYNGKVAQTFYFDTSAGRTANYDDIWGGGVYAYLKSVDSSVDKNSKAYPSSATYKASDIASWVKNTYKNRIIDLRDVDLMSITDRTKWFTPTYDANGVYVKTIKVGTKSIRGSYLRSYVLNSANCGSGKGIRSPAYRITYNKSDDTFTFTVYGYGHGVGMSQTGADLYAKAGWTYKQILTHYFTGISFGTYS